MGVVTVTGTFKRADGTAWSGLVVKIKPIYPNNPQREVLTYADGTVVPTSLTATADNNGLISVRLIPSSNYTPITPYVFEFEDPNSAKEFTLVGLVPDSNIDIKNLNAVNNFGGVTLPDGFIDPDMLKFVHQDNIVGDYVLVTSSTGDKFDLVAKGNLGGGGGGGSGTFIGLTDTPSAYSDNKRVVSTAIGIAFENDVEAWATVGNLVPIPASKIGARSISTSKIADDAVTDAKLADDSVNAGKIDTTTAGPDVRDSLVALTGADRLPASAVRDLPTGGGGGASSFTDLDDTPNDYDDGKLVRSGSAGLYYGDVTEDELPASVARDSEIENWAKTGNSDNIPASKLSNAPTSSNADIDARIADWAETANTDPIPANKLSNAPSSGGSSTFTGLSDTPSDLNPNKWLATNTAGDAVVEKEFPVTTNLETEHTITVGIPNATQRGYKAGAGGFGSIDVATSQLGATTYTIQEVSHDTGDGDLVFAVTPALPATGNNSQEDLTIVVNGHKFALSEFTRATATVNALAGTTFTLRTLHTLIPGTAGNTFKLLVETSILTKIEELTAREEPAEWAEVGNTDQIPANKLGNAPSTSNADIDARIADWAEEGNTHLIPDSKVPTISQVDRILDATATGVTTSTDVRIANLNTSITIGGTTSTIGLISQNTMNSTITLVFSGSAIEPLLNKYVLDINGERYHFPPHQRAIVGGNYQPTFTSEADILVAGSNTIQIYEPIDADNFVPGDGTDGRILGHVSGHPAWVDESATSNADIDARIADWAETGNTDLIPASKLTNAPSTGNDDIDARIADWAEASNTELIPTDKLPFMASGDVLASKTFTAVSAPDISGGGILDLDLAFTIGTTNYKFRQVGETAVNRFGVEIYIDGSTNAPNSQSDLRDYVIEVAGQEFRFNDATYVAGSGGTTSPDGYEWHTTEDIFTAGQDYTFTLYEPLDRANYVPGDGTVGYVLYKGATVPLWRPLGDAERLLGPAVTPIVGRKLEVGPITPHSFGQHTVRMETVDGSTGQAGTTREVVVYLWRRSSSSPSAPSGGTWDDGSWTSVPTGWYSTPGDVPASADTLYRASGAASESDGSWSVSGWEIVTAEQFNTRYSNSLNGASPYFAATTSSVAFNSRLPNGQWSSIWVPLTTIPGWQAIGSTDITVTSRSQSKVVGFGAPINLANVNDIRIDVTVYHSDGTTVGSVGTAIIHPNTLGIEAFGHSTTPHANSTITVRMDELRGLRVWVGDQVSLANLRDSVINNAQFKFYMIRWDDVVSYATVGTARFYAWGGLNQRGNVRLYIR